jgi:hypothetical protein
MAKPISVLAINFPFKNPAVVQEDGLPTNRALFDFDVVVIRPHALRAAVHADPWGTYQRLKGEFERKHEDLWRLLHDGKLLVVILDVVDSLALDSGGYSSRQKYTVTNYDFLDDQFFISIRNGKGQRFEITNQTEPFARVLRSSSVAWTAYVGQSLPYEFRDVKMFAKSGAGSFVGGVVGPWPGHIVFLPNFKELDEAEFLSACREYLFAGETTPAPEWAVAVHLRGELEAAEKVKAAQQRVEETQRALNEAVADVGKLTAYKHLLFEKGKKHLEPIVRRALDDLGFATTSSEDILGTNFEIDGRTTTGSLPGVLEVKGSKKQIGLDEFSPFVVKMLADLQQNQKTSKGILVGNGLCLERPETRLGERVFSQHVLDAAKQHSVALINSVELYWLVTGALQGNAEKCSAIREKILCTSGYVDLRQYCGPSPFRTHQATH